MHQAGRKMDTRADTRLRSDRYGHCTYEWHSWTSFAIVPSASMLNVTWRCEKGWGKGSKVWEGVWVAGSETAWKVPVSKCPAALPHTVSH